MQHVGRAASYSGSQKNFLSRHLFFLRGMSMVQGWFSDHECVLRVKMQVDLMPTSCNLTLPLTGMD